MSMVYMQRKLWSGTKGYRVKAVWVNSCSSVLKQADVLHIH